ncbi:uncharacterized protein C8A04DRAFT_27001 [Dichotomopilus funicola]|uniref:Peptidase S59 domain-containing protein n=1 Tax=Dichotomopilus funicola TaxID=1934379 RepID=A0AAN6ZPH4_9PEZI|nr:hypothetical protein C8A04DRAFT_27001 [Dichotomopilus funicola]
MAFGFGGGGGFGQNNNNNNQAGGFGGFGNTTATPGFGSTGNNAFGAANNANTTGGVFGGGGNAGFGGGNAGGFGAGGFGAKPAFGTPTTSSATPGGLFGSGATTATANAGGFGGGFGAANNNPSTPFGGGATNSLFGAAKPATTGFGAGNAGFGTTTNSGMFGGGNAGAGGFGASANPGIGTNVGDPPGTGGVPFAATVEKEPTSSTQSNSYQNILFMDAYKKFSADELRLADYRQGRKTGGTGGTGAFGGTNFGAGGNAFGANQGNAGFGANAAGGGVFGNNNQQAAGGFGAANNNAAGGFGAASGGGGLFGNKPAGGGLFGNTPAAQPAQTGGGLFGGGGAASNAFGGGATTGNAGFGANNNAAGGGLFGNNNNTAAKPGGFSFGNTGAGTTGATTGNAFGGNTLGTTSGGFGGLGGNAASGGGGLFGNANQNNTAGGGLFGGQQQQQQQQQQPANSAFGGGGGFGAQTQNAGGGGLFGNQAQQQQKPAGGLFGGTATTNATPGGGLFGGGANTGATAGFGAANTAQNAGGGLFGGNKPAATGGGLFGGGATNQAGATGGGLFGGLGGNTQTQQPQQQGGGLFGGLGQSTQAKPSLFGGSTTGGGGLFGGQPAQQQQQQQGGGLFGTTNNQQQPQLGNSLLGASQGQQAQQQAFNASIHDISAYGAATLFSGLPDDKVQNPGPLATPLSGKSKVKSRSILPMYKLSPANASRLATPQKRGYGFSYSAYGSPASPSSASSTPGGFSQSLLLAGNANRGLSKSISASNLRRSFSVEDSILQPGAFSASSASRLGNGSGHKKLIINKEVRNDLFVSPTPEKLAIEDASGPRKLTKRVSFDTSTEASTPTTRPAGTLENSSNNSGTDEQQTKSNGTSSTNGTNGMNGAKSPSVTVTAAAAQVEPVKGNELAIVPEEESPVAVRTEKQSGNGSSSVEPGGYWTSPPLEDLRAMNRVQRQRVPGFIVGREKVGSVAFQVPVDLSNINLDELFDNIVILVPRSATVYPVAAKKPPVGKGLNVPAVISLEHSYPRGGLATVGRRLERHIERLKTAIPDTKFVSYDKEMGVWTFSVEHFTTYGLGDDDDDDDDETEAESVGARVRVRKQQLLSRAAPAVSDVVVKKDSSSPSNPDDTFEFKRSRRAVPGAFDDDDAALSDIEEAPHADAGFSRQHQRQGTLSPEPQDADAPLPSREWPEDESMADGPDDYQLEAYEEGSQQGSVVDDAGYYNNNEAYDYPNDSYYEAQVPAGIMRARMRAFKKSHAPTRIEVTGGDDWTQILQASVRAPRTVDRATLRALNESGAVWDDIDDNNKEKGQDQGSPTAARQRRNAAPVVPDGAGFATSIDLMKSLFEQAKGPVPSPQQKQHQQQSSPAKGFVKWPYQQRPKVDHPEEGPTIPRTNWGPNELLVTAHLGEPSLQPVDGDNLASPTEKSSAASPENLARLQHYIDSVAVWDGQHQVVNVNANQEFRDLAQGDVAWDLASLLFDENGSKLPAFWRQLVSEATDRALAQPGLGFEEKAILALAGNRVGDACGHLLAAGNFRLATLVSNIGLQNKDIKAQLSDWRESNVLAEFSPAIRALYELLAGNASVCVGVKNVPIENRVDSFTISGRFGLDWMRSFGLRLFYTTGSTTSTTNVAEAVRSFQADIEQGREPEPDSRLWSLLKAFATQDFDWADSPRLGWLMTRAIYATGKVSFGQDAAEKLDMASLSFASALTVHPHCHWVPATFVLLQLSDAASREAAVRDHLGRHAHRISAPPRNIPSNNKTNGDGNKENTFTALLTLGVPPPWIWEAKALDFRARGASQHEFLALVWAENYVEAHAAFVHRVGPDLVIARSYTRLFRFAQLLYKVRDRIPGWKSGGAVVFLLFPMARVQSPQNGPATTTGKGGKGRVRVVDKFDEQLLDGLVALRAETHGDIRQEAAIADMAEELIRCRGGDARLFGLLPGDVRGRYVRAQALEGIR